MERKILDCVSYIKSISKQKVTLERIFLYMEKSDESVSEEETQKMIATLISLHQLEERGIVSKSCCIPSLSDIGLAPQMQIRDEDELSL